MKQIPQEESEHRTPERSLGNTEGSAEEEEMGSGAASQARTPDKPVTVSLKGSWQGRKAARGAMLFTV